MINKKWGVQNWPSPGILLPCFSLLMELFPPAQSQQLLSPVVGVLSKKWGDLPYLTDCPRSCYKLFLSQCSGFFFLRWLGFLPVDWVWKLCALFWNQDFGILIGLSCADWSYLVIPMVSESIASLLFVNVPSMFDWLPSMPPSLPPPQTKLVRDLNLLFNLIFIRTSYNTLLHLPTM